MGKTQVAASSLILAIPAAGLAYVTIMAGLRHTENMPTLMMVLVWVTFALSAFMAAMPVIAMALVKSPGGDGSPAAGAVAESSAAPAADIVDDDDSGLAETTDLGDLSEVEDDSSADMEAVSDSSMSEVEDLGDLDDDISVDDDAFDLDDIEEEEEAPKKKKKK
jgi:hypothetical protein